jgi:hypothetical protein
MRQLCPVLTTLPIGPSHPGRTAGPALEIAAHLLRAAHGEPAWKIITERLSVLTEACAPSPKSQVAALSNLAGDLRSMTRDIRTHLDKRAASSDPGYRS